MAQENKAALLKELSSCFAQLKQVDKAALKYLSKDSVQAIKEAKVTLTNDSSSEASTLPISKPEIDLWFERVVQKIIAEEAQIIKEKFQEFNPEKAKNYLSGTLKGLSINNIENYIFGLVCHEISSGQLHFSENYDVTTFVGSLKDGFSNTLLALCAQSGHYLESAEELPPIDFLAKKLLMLYIESSKDNQGHLFFDMDKGEYTKINAGHVYFKIEGFFDRRRRTTEDGEPEDYLVFVKEKTDGSPRVHSDAPFIDDIPGDQNIINLLTKLHGANTKIVDLPIKVKVATTINVSEAVGTGRGTVAVGGASGVYTIVCEREIEGRWNEVTGVSLAKIEALGFDLDDYLNNKLLVSYIVSDLVPE